MRLKQQDSASGYFIKAMMQNKSWPDHSLRLIIPLVILAHACIAWLILMLPEDSVVKSSGKRLVTMTVKLTPAPSPQVVVKPLQAEVKSFPLSLPEVEAPQEKEITPAPAPPKKLSVEPQKPAVVKKPSKRVKTPAAVAKKPTAPPKKVAKDKPVVAKQKEVSQSSIKRDATPSLEKEANVMQATLQRKQRELIARAKENMEKVNTRSLVAAATSPSSQAMPPARIESLQIDSLEVEASSTGSPQEMTYRDELAQRLKLLVKLPEYGEVRLTLTLNRAGKVIHVHILQSTSKANRQHVEKNLPSLHMPAFGNNFESQAEYTFTITMSNEL